MTLKFTSATIHSIILLLSTISFCYEEQLPLRGLKQYAGKKLFGTLYDNCCISKDSLYMQETIIRKEFAIITNGNFFIDLCHPLIDVYDFEKADSVNHFATDNNISIRGHSLIWYAHVPEWLEKQALTSRDSAIALLKNHIIKVVSHNKGIIKYWDVINEPIDDNGTLRKSFYENLLGPHYIDSALIWTHRADSSAELFINEYQIEFGGNKFDSLYVLAKRLLAEKIPLHGIGFQCHFRIDDQMNFRDMQKAIDRIAALGLRIHFTEIDIRAPDIIAPAVKIIQNSAYKNITELLLKNSCCDAFIVWGLSDAHSWIPRQFKGWGNACLFDKYYLPKDTYRSVINTIVKINDK